MSRSVKGREEVLGSVTESCSWSPKLGSLYSRLRQARAEAEKGEVARRAWRRRKEEEVQAKGRRVVPSIRSRRGWFVCRERGCLVETCGVESSYVLRRSLVAEGGGEKERRGKKGLLFCEGERGAARRWVLLQPERRSEVKRVTSNNPPDPCI